MSATAHEVNFDGIVGPTHNYAGLSYGNFPSKRHAHQEARPRAAALQGLAKIKLIADLGIRQAVLPPHQRPDLEVLRAVGFSGTDEQILQTAHREAPSLMTAASSASAMWTANAATVSPAPDTANRKVHLTAANLIGNLHRSIEAPQSSRILKRIFADRSCFAHHDPLPASTHFSDEGAANHTRLCCAYGEPGIELFTFGREEGHGPAPSLYPARQSAQASRALARLHQLDPEAVVFAQQHPEAIDAGAFHHDVIAVGNQNVLLCHQKSLMDQQRVLDELRTRFERICGAALIVIEIPQEEVTLAKVIDTYLFNSQLLTLPDGTMAMVCPDECRQNTSTAAWLGKLVIADNPIASVRPVNLRQSIQNGGGPACLRLRVVLSEHEQSRVMPGVMWTAALGQKLRAWVNRHYRETLNLDDLPDPDLLKESRTALEELTKILAIGSIYPFQR